MKTSAEIIQEQIAKMSKTERRAIFPPMIKKNFVVRKSWYGRGQIITFTPKPTKLVPKPKPVTYDHDIALDLMRERLNIMPAWKKYGYWSQSTNIPLTLRYVPLLSKADEKLDANYVAPKKK
jgi:hypothetical protein